MSMYGGLMGQCVKYILESTEDLKTCKTRLLNCELRLQTATCNLKLWPLIFNRDLECQPVTCKKSNGMLGQGHNCVNYFNKGVWKSLIRCVARGDSIAFEEISY